MVEIYCIGAAFTLIFVMYTESRLGKRLKKEVRWWHKYVCAIIWPVYLLVIILAALTPGI